MARDSFCESMEALQLRRIFVLGDSLQYQKLISFFNLMGFEADHPITKSLHTHRNRAARPITRTTLPCSPSFSIDFVFHRVNHFTPLLGNHTTGRNQIQREQDFKERTNADTQVKDIAYFVCYGIRKRLWPDEEGNCPWVNEYLASDAPTLLLTGVGAQFHSVTAYRESLDQFLDLLRTNPRPNDIVWIQTTNTGHVPVRYLQPDRPLFFLPRIQSESTDDKNSIGTCSSNTTSTRKNRYCFGTELREWIFWTSTG